MKFNNTYTQSNIQIQIIRLNFIELCIQNSILNFNIKNINRYEI